MKRFLFLLSYALFLLSYSSFSQEYSYTHYDVKDGIAGSTVYCITQDRDGFIWMGTEAGVSRFDGTHFKNFSMDDGLPDIEVLEIMADSKGRIWMGTFSKSICFYYKGRIHNQDNDPQLKQMHISSTIESFAEDREGNILAQERSILHLITRDGRVQEISTIEGQPINSYVVSTGEDGKFLVQNDHNIYRFSENNFVPVLSFNYSVDPHVNFIALNANLVAWKKDPGFDAYLSFGTGGGGQGSLRKGASTLIVTFSPIGDSLVYTNQGEGSLETNVFTGKTRYFKLDAKISRTFRDDEGNLWFTSLGQGIFRLNSDDIRNITLWTKKSTRCVVHSIVRQDNELLVGASYSMLFRFALPSFKDIGSYKVIPTDDVDEFHFVRKTKEGALVIGASIGLFRVTPPETFKYALKYSVKSAALKNDSELLIAGFHGVYLMTLHDIIQVKDRIWHERGTFVYYKDDVIYIGALNGLYVKKKNGPVEYWGDKDPILRKRVSSITQAPDGTLWIATYGQGIIALKEGRRVAVFGRKQGLSSDLCRTLTLHDGTLWVGTDKGLNKIDISNPEYPVTTYTANDGLGSDIINVVYVDSSRVYVGTPAGLSFFDVTHTGESGGCRLVMIDLINSGKDRINDTASLHLPYDHNNIRFGFVGVSYRSAGDISYRYRLLGLDSTWKKTKESFLEYPTLPSGDYELQLQAVNKFGISSKPLSIRFIVNTPFWKTAWFDAAALLLFLALIWLFFSLRIKHLRRREAEKEALHRRLAETEHMALQSQMNPHFIFNCLNSIQQYIFDQDILAANKYITGFAKLIRATLQNSSKQFISLADEVDYLSSYLSLEKLRFKEKMDYSIDIEPSLHNDLEEIHIPPMLIQPYVENCMRHGLRHRAGKGGFIRIIIMQEGDKLAFIIEDNGIGREQAARYKTREHIEYQSRGMSMTADRIRLINTVSGGSIQVEVLDLKGREGKSSGTRVIVRFPRFDLFYQKNTI